MYGYMGKVLFINLSGKGSMEIEPLDEDDARGFLGGPGLGAKILYREMPAHADVFGEESMIGFVSGPLNNTKAMFGGRYTVVSKSPVTGGWNDANSGGFFGKKLKRSGYDAVFINGISEKPVYIYINNGKTEILDASDIWGLTTKAVEEKLMKKHGKDIGIALIGPGGENLSYFAAVMNDSHRAAARGGSGAVMGSKRLKAVVVKGNQKTREAHPFKAFKINIGTLLHMLKGMVKDKEMREFPKYGTGGTYTQSIKISDAGFKNWTASMSPKHTKSRPRYTEGDAIELSSQSLNKYKTKKFCCPQCLVGCSIHMDVKTDRWGKLETTRPEYETMGAFGSLMMNTDVESVIKANDMCNEYGFDTISAGSTIAWAMECYENGVFTKDDLNGIELSWGNGSAVVSLMELICKNEGIGAVLAKGSLKASKILKKGEEFLVVANGIEEPQHDARLIYGLGRTYFADPTPGRHVKASIGRTTSDPDFDPEWSLKGTGLEDIMAIADTEIMNASGVCAFGFSYGNPDNAVMRNIMAVTGFNYSGTEILQLGLRIFTMRQAFNLREGIQRSDFAMSERMKKSKPPFDGPLEDISLDINTMVDSLYDVLEWTKEGVPTEAALLKLGYLEDVKTDIYGEAESPDPEENANSVNIPTYYAGRHSS